MNKKNKNPDYLYLGHLNEKEFVGIYDELPYWSAPFGIEILDLFIPKKGMKVLDIGSGCGFPLLEIANRLDEKSEITGIDPWKPGIKRILKKSNLQGLTNVNLLNIGAEDISFTDNYFDCVVSNNGINNVRNQRMVLENCFRVLKEKGSLIVSVNLPGTMQEFYKPLKKFYINDKNKTSEIDNHIRAKRKSVKELEKIICRVGFKLEKIIIKEFYYRFCSGSAFFNHFLIKTGFLSSWKQIIGKEFETVKQEIVKELDRGSKKSGCVKMSIPYCVILAVK